MKNLQFRTMSMEKLNRETLVACAKLFSENYGRYSYDENLPEFRRGQQIKMSASYYEKNYVKSDFFISYAEDCSQLIGHAIYLRKRLTDGKIMTWVVQLVVHKDYRGQGIGKKLLNAAWGFSNDAGWGLATSNPYTVKTLEASTFRKVNPEYVISHLAEIKELAQLVNFVSEFKVDSNQSVVNSNFFVDHTNITTDIERTFGTSNWILGKLDPGEEWLAFTFSDQDFAQEYDEEFIKLLEFSEANLKEAYGRMNEQQGWQGNAQYEAEYIAEKCGLGMGASVLDFGCGNGRHFKVFAKLGMKVTGVDFSRKANIDNGCLKFVAGDCRYYHSEQAVDLVIALYDVVGSFPNDKDNDRIIKNAHENLKSGGYFVLSVMNLELTQFLAKPEYTGELMKNLKILQSLPASNTMQSTGNVFNPDYYFLDPVSSVVYRKEQFKDDQHLSVEHIIRDRRYTVADLRKKLEQADFEVIEIRPVKLGAWDKELNSTDIQAKEILAICRKH